LGATNALPLPRFVAAREVGIAVVPQPTTVLFVRVHAALGLGACDEGDAPRQSDTNSDWPGGEADDMDSDMDSDTNPEPPKRWMCWYRQASKGQRPLGGRDLRFCAWCAPLFVCARCWC
jgi:hypothetical protein